jgi:hypothetical protein
MLTTFLTRTGRVAAIALMLLAWPAAADPVPTLKIVLQVPDASVPLHLVLRARDEVTRIYRDAGVVITWKDVTPNSDELDAPQSTGPAVPGFALVVISSRNTDTLTVATDALGGATGTAETRGRVAYVFYDRVERTARAHLNRKSYLGTSEMDTVIVLGHAMAHEIGHLLLPRGHSALGLMRADWSTEDLRDAAHGELNFTPEQAEALRETLLTRMSPSNADGL